MYSYVYNIHYTNRMYIHYNFFLVNLTLLYSIESKGARFEGSKKNYFIIKYQTNYERFFV